MVRIDEAAVVGVGVMEEGLAQVPATVGLEVACVDRSSSQMRVETIARPHDPEGVDTPRTGRTTLLRPSPAPVRQRITRSEPTIRTAARPSKV